MKNEWVDRVGAPPVDNRGEELPTPKGGFLKAVFAKPWAALLPGFALLALDRGLKAWCAVHLELGERRPFPGILHRIHLTHFLTPRPPGGLSGGWNVWQLPLLLLSVLVITVVVRFRRATTAERICYGLLLASGVSNLWDLWRLGAAMDPLEMATGAAQVMPFNFADLGISTGAMALSVLLVARMLKDSSRRTRRVR